MSQSQKRNWGVIAFSVVCFLAQFIFSAALRSMEGIQGTSLAILGWVIVPFLAYNNNFNQIRRVSVIMLWIIGVISVISFSPLIERGTSSELATRLFLLTILPSFTPWFILFLYAKDKVEAAKFDAIRVTVLKDTLAQPASETEEKEKYGLATLDDVLIKRRSLKTYWDGDLSEYQRNLFRRLIEADPDIPLYKVDQAIRDGARVPEIVRQKSEYNEINSPWEVALTESQDSLAPRATSKPLPLDNWPRASVILSYSRDGVEAWRMLSLATEDQRIILLNSLDADPSLNATQLARDILNRESPYQSQVLRSAHLALAEYGPEAQAELKRAVDLIGEKLDVEFAVERIKEKLLKILPE